MADKYAPKKGNMGAPAPGSYAPPKAEHAQNTSASIPDSAWSERSGDRGLNSRQPSSKYPSEAVHQDNKRAVELLKSDTSHQAPDRSGKFFR